MPIIPSAAFDTVEETADKMLYAIDLFHHVNSHHREETMICSAASEAAGSNEDESRSGPPWCRY